MALKDAGPDGLKDAWYSGLEPRLSTEQKAKLVQIVETVLDPAADKVVRWRRIDLQKVISERFRVFIAGQKRRVTPAIKRQMRRR